VMIQVLLRDLAEHFTGHPLDALYLNTNAKQPGTLAAADRMAYMLMLGLAGFRTFFLGAGLLSMDEVFSPVQFVIDMEIGRYVQRIVEGMPWQAEAGEIAQAVAEGVTEGTFLVHATTLGTMRAFFDSPSGRPPAGPVSRNWPVRRRWRRLRPTTLISTRASRLRLTTCSRRRAESSAWTSRLSPSRGTHMIAARSPERRRLDGPSRQLPHRLTRRIVGAPAPGPSAPEARTASPPGEGIAV